LLRAADTAITTVQTNHGGLLASLAQPRGAGARPSPPKNCFYKKIPGCAVELNTQNCAWFGSQIPLITAMSFREAMPPRTTHQGLCPWTLLGDFRSPDPLCPPSPNPGYATDWHCPHRRSRVYASVGRPPVSLSVCPSMGHSSKLCCCNPACSRYRSTAARRTAARRADTGIIPHVSVSIHEHRLL